MKLNWREEEKKAKREAEMEERLRRLVWKTLDILFVYLLLFSFEFNTGDLIQSLIFHTELLDSFTFE